MTKSAELDVDVIIPAYNSAPTIESAVGSIMGQTVHNIRVIVVNDGSTDGTQEILERMAGRDHRVLLIAQPHSGVVDALNTGLRACRAEFVARHDADDVALGDRLARQLAFLRNHPDVAISGAVVHIDQAGRPLGRHRSLRSPDLANPYTYPQLEPYLIHPFLMVRRRDIEEIGGYRYVFHAEDTDLYWRLQERGRLTNMPDLLGYYRIHDHSVTGASITNGRISALNSQRAGISAIRRRSGQPDIEFPNWALVEYQKARSLEGIIKIGCRDLDPTEAHRLAVATCAKMLELAGYRPYELDDEDCEVIRDVLIPELPHMSPDNRVQCVRMLSGSAARIALNGNFSAARRLVPPRLYPVAAAKLAYRMAAPASARRLIRHVAGRDGIVK